MSKKFDNKLILKVNTSLCFVGIVLIIHLGGGLAVVVTPWSWLLRLPLLGLLAVSLAYVLVTHGWRRGGSAVRELAWGQDDSVVLRVGGRRYAGCRPVSWAIAPWLVVLSVQCPGQWLRRSVVLCADAVDPEMLRQLRVRLNQYRPHDAQRIRLKGRQAR